MTSQPSLAKADTKASDPGNPQGTGGDGLKAGLKNRHLSMIAIGGVIGAGLFVGSSSGIAT
ncbi:amino acid transporter, partial [Streptomyces sp. NPDC002896]